MLFLTGNPVWEDMYLSELYGGGQTSGTYGTKGGGRLRRT